MKRKTISWILPACVAGVSAFGQTSSGELPLISAGAGLTVFHGDVGNVNHTGGIFRSAYRFGITQRFSNWIGAEAFGHYGTLSRNERSLSLNRNFESPVLFAGLNAVLYLDNDVIIKRGGIFAPYITAGFGWMSFDPHGDLKAANDSTYHYWSDGSIKDIAENSPFAAFASSLQRDYTYETQLKDSSTNYQRSTYGIPLGVGMQIRFGQHFGVKLQANYFITFSDYIDNVKKGGNDSWWWYGGSVYYKFGKGEKEKNDGADVAAMLKEDYDGDGVSDADDQCQGTPAGVKVDVHGCPLDSDEDGIPDYRDKEMNSAKGAVVDADGVTIDFTKIEEQARKDSTNAAQKNEFNSNPSLQTLKQGDKDLPAKTGGDCIPAEYRAADFNKDCVISADEINRVIDEFFDGTGGNWTADKINRLIDFFFDQ